MSDERKRSVWPWIVALLIGLPVLYVASFGPACWWISRLNRQSGGGQTQRWIGLIYSPCGQLTCYGPVIARKPLWWYASLGIPDNTIASVPVGWRKWQTEGI